jgi:hypothetical protein
VGVKHVALTTEFKKLGLAVRGEASAPRDSNDELLVKEAAVKNINEPTLSRVRRMSVSSLAFVVTGLRDEVRGIQWGHASPRK